MIGRKICFNGEIWIIILKLSLLSLLIWSTKLSAHCQKTESNKNNNAVKGYVVSIYRIYPAIRQGFVPLEQLQITKSVLWNFAVIPVLPFLNNPKDLDLSYKTDLDLWDCFGWKKTPSFNRRNTVGLNRKVDARVVCKC